MNVYFAAPVTTYLTRHYHRGLTLTKDLFEYGDVISARDEFKSTDDWLEKWPKIMPTINVVVFISDEDGWIGKGVWREINDVANNHGIVAYLDRNLMYRYPLEWIEFIDWPSPSWRYYKRVKNP